jgi:LPS-assembly protein
MKTGEFYLTGEEIEKTGESSYLVHKGEFTTCGWNRPAWTFASKKVNVTMGEYATAHWSTFRILGQKVLYLPWGIFPVKTERQSGLLMPEFQLSSRDGTIFRSAYFWAIDKDKDATLYLDWIQDRGIKPGVEYRYRPSETTTGTWYFSDIDDRKYGHNRYQIRGEHEQQFFGDMDFKLDGNYVSDYKYLQDLGLTTVARSESSLRSVAFIEKPFTKSFLTVEAAYFQDLTQKNNDATLQQLPSASYFTEYLPILGSTRAYTDFTTNLTNFTRSQGDKATRLLATPSLRVPYSWNGMNFLGSGGFVERAYYSDPASPRDNDSVHHEAVRVQADMNMAFVKNSHTDFYDIGQMQSSIRPRLQYDYVQNMSSFANIPTMDASDRIYNTNSITYSFNHYLNAIAKDGSLRELSLLEVSQTYGLTNKLRGDPYLYQGSGSRFSQIHSRLTLAPHSDLSYVHDDYWDVSGNGLQNMTNSLHYARPPGFVVDLSHSYSPDVLDQIYLNTLVKWRVFDVIYQIRYDFMAKTWIDMLASVTYHPTCWGVTFTMTRSQNPSDTSFRVYFSLQGIAQNIGGK